MKPTTFVVLFCIFTVLPNVNCWYNAVLQFPETPSTSNYVILTPDFTAVRDGFTICTWLKSASTGNSYGVWFSYQASTSDDNEIGLSDSLSAWTEQFNDNLVISDTVLSKNRWYHYCLTWSFAQLLRELYIDGELVGSKATASGRYIGVGGTVVLGQDQDSPGGGFDSGQIYGGQLYELNVLSKKLTAEEVKAMYERGRCARLDPSLFPYAVLQWEDFLMAKRNGGVEAVDGSCSNWNMIGDLIDSELLQHMMQFHPF